MTFDELAEEFAAFFFLDAATTENLSASTSFADDLSFDSLDLFELLLFVEEIVGRELSVDFVMSIQTLGEVADWIGNQTAQTAR